MHYLSPSGCTFWGKKPWSRKKKLLWQLGTIVGAPVGIALIAGISIPAMVIGNFIVVTSTDFLGISENAILKIAFVKNALFFFKQLKAILNLKLSVQL